MYLCIFVFRIYIPYYNSSFFFEDSMYKITDYTKRKAHEVGVKVVPSVNSKKKIDIWKDGKRIASVGSISYADYPTYIETKGKAYADIRKNLYAKRHAKDISVKGSNGYYAYELLWN